MTEPRCDIGEVPGASRPHVVFIGSNAMGEGSQELGEALMKAFVNTIKDVRPLPDKVLLVNSGVKLTTEGSAVLDAFRNLEEQGVILRSCGTCLDYFGLADKLAVGKVTNMYEILNDMTQAGHVIKP